MKNVRPETKKELRELILETINKEGRICLSFFKICQISMEKSPTGMCQRLLICTVCLIMLEHSTSHLISGTYQKWNVSNVGDMYCMLLYLQI